MKRITLQLTLIGFWVFLVIGTWSISLAAEVPRINKDELKTLIEKKEVTVLDVRAGKDWSSSTYKISTAVREDPNDVKPWAEKYSKADTLVLYCA